MDENAAGQSNENTFQAVLVSFRLLNGLAIASVTYFFVSILARFFGTGTASFLGVVVSQTYAIYVLFGITILHLVVLRYIIYDLSRAWEKLDKNSRIELYLKITGSGGLIVKGAERFRDNIRNNDGFLFLRVSNDDPPSLIHWFAFFTASLACVRYEASFDFVWTSILAFLMAMTNWQIGSSWLVALADFGRDAEESLYFDNDLRRGPRYFGIVSGPWHGMNNNVFLFALISTLDAFLRIFVLSAFVFGIWVVLKILEFLPPLFS